MTTENIKHKEFCPNCNSPKRTYMGFESNIGLEGVQLWECGNCGDFYNSPIHTPVFLEELNKLLIL